MRKAAVPLPCFTLPSGFSKAHVYSRGRYLTKALIFVMNTEAGKIPNSSNILLQQKTFLKICFTQLRICKAICKIDSSKLPDCNHWKSNAAVQTSLQRYTFTVIEIARNPVTSPRTSVIQYREVSQLFRHRRSHVKHWFTLMNCNQATLPASLHPTVHLSWREQQQNSTENLPNSSFPN